MIINLNVVLAGVDIVIHLACSTVPKQSNLDPKLDVEVNLIGSLNVLNAYIAQSIKRFFLFLLAEQFMVHLRVYL